MAVVFLWYFFYLLMATELAPRDKVVPNFLTCIGDFALLALSMSPLIFLECLMGTSDMNSTPPAMQVSYTPAFIRPRQVVMA